MSEVPELLNRYITSVERLKAAVQADLARGDVLTILDDEASLLALEEDVISKRREETAPYYAAKNGIEQAYRPVVRAIEELKLAVEQWLERWGAESLREYGSVTISHPDLTARTVWAYEVVDESAIPRQFLKVDEKALEEHIDKFGDAVPVPGVRVFRTIKIRRRSSK